MEGGRLREQIRSSGLTYVEAARRLGLTTNALHKQMRGARRVSRQTEILVAGLPDREDFEAVMDTPADTTKTPTENDADRYRQAQAHKLIRLYERGLLPPDLMRELDKVRSRRPARRPL
jgi:hypothetical protein